MVILQAILLGIIEGLTEFLPISSTGHLIVAEHALGYKDSARLFTVVIQVGAIAAVAWYYRRDLLHRLAATIRRETAAINFWINLIIAAVPASLVGLALNDYLDRYALPSTVAVALIAGGILLWIVEVSLPKRKVAESSNLTSTKGLDSMTRLQALAVGFAQVVSLIPGVSRSGATIVGGLLAGMSRLDATAFSFYLGMPMLILASGYKLANNRHDIALVSGGSPALLAGTLAAFVSALVVVGWLLKYIAKHDFKPFAYYRIIFGMLVIILILTGVLPNTL